MKVDPFLALSDILKKSQPMHSELWAKKLKSEADEVKIWRQACIEKKIRIEMALNS